MTAPTERSRVIVGLMSGTSLDGISAAVVRFDRGSDGRYAYELLGMSVRAYDGLQRERLAQALVGSTPREYCRLSFDLGNWLADAAIAAIADAGVGRADVAAIASHGQTVWHEPGHSTWQFGQPAVIAERTGIDVISDFRVRDVAAGGQGAPLVPAADALLFAHTTDWRALQNLGGIGNVTIVPPGGIAISTRAFDTGPGVVVIDGVTRAVAPGLTYDVDGKPARGWLRSASSSDACRAPNSCPSAAAAATRRRRGFGAGSASDRSMLDEATGSFEAASTSTAATARRARARRAGLAGSLAADSPSGLGGGGISTLSFMREAPAEQLGTKVRRNR